MYRFCLLLCALLPAQAALAQRIQPGLYERTGSRTVQIMLDGKGQPGEPPSKTPPAPVCIPADSAAWLARRIAATHPSQAKLAFEVDPKPSNARAQWGYYLLEPTPLECGYSPAPKPRRKTSP